MRTLREYIDLVAEADKQLDPEIYGEELPIAKVRQIVQNIMFAVDPTAPLKIKGSPEGYYIVESPKLNMAFGITADGGEISANIERAYSSYKGANVVTDILKQCFAAMEKKFGKPTAFVISPREDRGHGVWQHVAQKLGAKYGGGTYQGDTSNAVSHPA
jgi:hypothetical protein